MTRECSQHEMERLLVALAVHLIAEQGGHIVVPAIALEMGGAVNVSGDDEGTVTFSMERN